MTEATGKAANAGAKGAAAASMVLLLAGCASTLPTADLRVPLPEAWQNAQAVVAPSSEHQGAGAWWQTFHDPALDRLIQATLQSNLTIAAAAAHLRAARALIPAGAAPYRPNLSLSTGSPVSPDARASYFQAGFDATWELPLFDRAENAGRVLGAQAGAANADLAAAQTSVAAEVASAYLTAHAAVRRQALLRDLEAFEQGRLARLRTRVRVGLETPREGQTAEADLLAIQARATEPDPTLAQSLQRIAALMGRATIDPTWIPSATALSVPVVRLESTPADLLRERPDVRHAEFVVLRAAAELGTAQAELYPHISLVGAITAATRVSGGVGLSSNSVLSAGPAISIPLFDWGMRRAARDARAEELSAAALAYRQTVFDAVADVEITLASLNHSVSLIDLLQHAVASRDEAARRSSALRRAGLTENIEIASTARSAIEARLELEEAQYAGMIAVVQLHKALGGALMPGES